MAPDIENDDPAKVNAHLRRVFNRATVGMSQPALRGQSKWVPTIDFEWRDPSIRYGDDADDATFEVA